MAEWNLIPSGSVIDYLGLCFAINASVAFEKVQDLFRSRFHRKQEKGTSALTIWAKDSDDLKSAAEDVVERVKEEDRRFDQRILTGRTRADIYAAIGCCACFIAAVMAEHPYVGEAHGFNLLYVSPLFIFIADLSLVWFIWRWNLRRYMKPWKAYAKTQEKAEKQKRGLCGKKGSASEAFTPSITDPPDAGSK